MDPKYPEIAVELTGQDGNAFAILGRVKKALREGLREMGMPTNDVDTELDTFFTEATSGDYDHLLQTVMQWVTVE